MEAQRSPPAIVRVLPFAPCPYFRRRDCATARLAATGANSSTPADSRRSQCSTIAQMFSQELMDIFRIDNSVADLDEKVDKRSVVARPRRCMQCTTPPAQPQRHQQRLRLGTDADPCAVHRRKQQINSQASELEALQARIREMEARLNGSSTSNNRPSGTPAQSSDSSAPPPPLEKDSPVDQNQARDQQQKYGGSRPGTARQAQTAVPGALPPTPAGSEGESEPSVTRSSRIVPRPPGARAQSHRSPPRTTTGLASHAPPSATRVKEIPVPGGDSDSIKSVSESASFADYVIVPAPDGDRERDA